MVWNVSVSDGASDQHDAHTTNTILLRKWRQEDMDSLVQHANNVKIFQNLRDVFPHPYTEKDAQDWINLQSEPVDTRDLVDVAVVVSGCPVGGIGFKRFVDVERFTVELGYWLGEEYWGKGIMTSVVPVFCQWIFDNNPQIERIEAKVYDHNMGSSKVLQRAGFSFEGTARRACFKNGKFVHTHQFSLLRSDLAPSLSS